MVDAKQIWILNGPNLNLLGNREPEIYGNETLDQIMNECHHIAEVEGYHIVARQSNHEGQLIDWIHEAREKAQGLIINAGAYSHTSIAMADALRCLSIPIIEVHLTNLWRRENYRHTSYISEVVNAVVAGLGGKGYKLSLQALFNILSISRKG